MDMIRVASAQYWIRPISTWNEFSDQVESVIRTSADYGSELVVLPEYFTSQLLSLGDPRRSLSDQIRSLTNYVPAYLAFFTGLARKHGVYIVGGSIPVQSKGSKKVSNVSFLFSPSGDVGSQGKLHMTRFEKEEWKVSPSSQLRVFETSFGKIAIAICYDIEFPEVARAAARAGAQIIAVPSCTDTRPGFLRVRYCAQARAIENQLYVVHSSTVGGLPQIPSVHLNYGISSILTPCDYAFARDGVLAEGTANQEAIVFGDLSLKALAASRKKGTVIPFHDSERTAALVRSVKTIQL